MASRALATTPQARVGAAADVARRRAQLLDAREDALGLAVEAARLVGGAQRAPVAAEEREPHLPPEVGREAGDGRLAQVHGAGRGRGGAEAPDQAEGGEGLEVHPLALPPCIGGCRRCICVMGRAARHSGGKREDPSWPAPTLRRRALLAAPLALAAVPAAAKGFPMGPVTPVVGFSAGGGTDT